VLHIHTPGRSIVWPFVSLLERLDTGRYGKIFLFVNALRLAIVNADDHTKNLGFLMDLARFYDLRRPWETLQYIAAAVARWPEFGKQAGVPNDEIQRIASFHPDWVKKVA